MNNKITAMSNKFNFNKKKLFQMIFEKKNYIYFILFLLSKQRRYVLGKKQAFNQSIF